MRQSLTDLFFSLRLDEPLRHWHRKDAVILMYHGFTDKPAHEGIENFQANRLHVAKFREQIVYLKQRHAVIPLERLLDHLAGGARVPNYSVVIAIDDGYRSVYTLAYPILKGSGVPASVFPATEFVEHKVPLWPDRVEYALERTSLKEARLEAGGRELQLVLSGRDSRKAAAVALGRELKTMPEPRRSEALKQIEHRLGQKLRIDAETPEIYRPLEWDDIREMAQSGLVSIGSHGHTHTILTHCGMEGARSELSLSKRMLEEKVGKPCTLFCYPNGWLGDFDDGTKRLLKESGYRCGLTTLPGFTRAKSDAYELRRFGTDNNDRLSNFKMSFCLGRSLLTRIKLALAI
ncbi:MAG: polysaccharide deacetylase family protein [Elusimicrobia bacterium]|nr:polysaccharide deacetylase family protein [Elusimicrobiota bacterium]